MRCNDDDDDDDDDDNNNDGVDEDDDFVAVSFNFFFSQKDIDNGAELSPLMVEQQDINMKFFPAAPVERDLLNRVSY